MPKLFDHQTGVFLGSVSDADLQVLIDQLEEEHGADNDYYINGTTVDMLEGAGASAEMVGLLRRALGSSDELDVRYEK